LFRTLADLVEYYHEPVDQMRVNYAYSLIEQYADHFFNVNVGPVFQDIRSPDFEQEELIQLHDL
jgi:hypothetical protein